MGRYGPRVYGSSRNRRFFDRRLELDLTLAALAEAAGVSEPTVSRAERGLRIRPLQQQRLAQALGLTREELFDDPDADEVAV